MSLPNTDWVTQIGRKPFVDSREYQFTRVNGRDVTGNLSVAGAKTVTITNVPAGVNGANTSHYVYISGGTGTAEAVLITGGTAVAGAASGTLTFTTANTHTGAWKITSATAGIQEAIWATGGRGRVVITPDNHLIYATITVPPTYLVSLRGSGVDVTRLTPQFTDADVVFIDCTTTGVVDTGDYSIVAGGAQTAGALLHVKKAVFGFVSNVLLESGWDNFEAEMCNDADFGPIQSLYATDKAIYIHTGAAQVSAGTYHDIQASCNNTTGKVVSIGGGGDVVGLGFSNLILQGGAYNIYADPEGGQINEVRFVNYSVDGADVASVKLTYGGGGGTGNGWLFSGGRGGTGGHAAGVFEIEDAYTDGIIQGFTGGTGGDAPGIWLKGVKNWKVLGVDMAGGSTGGATDIGLLIGHAGAIVCDDVIVQGCRFGRSEASGTVTTKYGISVTAVAHNNIRITDTVARGTTADLAWAATGTGNCLAGNDCVTGKPDAATYGAALRGSTWYTAAAAGSADTYELLAKAADNSYSWASLL